MAGKIRYKVQGVETLLCGHGIQAHRGQYLPDGMTDEAVKHLLETGVIVPDQQEEKPEPKHEPKPEPKPSQGGKVS